MNNKRCFVGYPPEKNTEDDQVGLEKIAKAFFGDLDPEEMADFAAQHRERRLLRKQKALKNAQDLLRQAQRPVRRQDMLNAMENAILTQVANYEKVDSITNAVTLVAIVICKNMLLDGPLHEGA